MLVVRDDSPFRDLRFLFFLTATPECVCDVFYFFLRSSISSLFRIRKLALYLFLYSFFFSFLAPLLLRCVRLSFFSVPLVYSGIYATFWYTHTTRKVLSKKTPFLFCPSLEVQSVFFFILCLVLIET